MRSFYIDPFDVRFQSKKAAYQNGIGSPNHHTDEATIYVILLGKMLSLLA